MIEKELKHERKEGREEGREEGKEEGIKEGIKKGKEEGKKENQIEIAENCLKKGLTVELIVQITNLSIEEVMEIKTRLKL